MLSVEEALARILAAFRPLPAEIVSVADGLGRTLAEPVVARVTQPPADVSAMDGYAARAADMLRVPATLRLVGAVPAGSAFAGRVGPGEAVRIFTGAPVPAGADTIVLQEDAAGDGDRVTVREGAPPGRYIRRMGLDFTAGEVGIPVGRRLTARDVGLAAAMNVPWLAVRRRPRVAILATGDEIVMPGDPIGPNQIVSSNALALAALVAASGGIATNLGIARDDPQALARLATGAEGADLLLTTGGASVGEHDLVRSVLGGQGMTLDFWKIAMRPGKPLMFGRLGSAAVLGLPGNPVSSLVCGALFVRPALATMLGQPADDGRASTAVLGTSVGANDRRQDYLRATLSRDRAGALVATPFPEQDSSMLTRLAWADCLVVRPPHAPAAAPGTRVPIVALSDTGCGL